MCKIQHRELSQWKSHRSRLKWLLCHCFDHLAKLQKEATIHHIQNSNNLSRKDTITCLLQTTSHKTAITPHTVLTALVKDNLPVTGKHACATRWFTSDDTHGDFVQQPATSRFLIIVTYNKFKCLNLQYVWVGLMNIYELSLTNAVACVYWVELGVSMRNKGSCMRVLIYIVIVVYQVRFTEDVGKVYKVRLSFDDDDDNEQNWLLDTVRKSIQNVHWLLSWVSCDEFLPLKSLMCSVWKLWLSSPFMVLLLCCK